MPVSGAACSYKESPSAENEPAVNRALSACLRTYSPRMSKKETERDATYPHTRPAYPLRLYPSPSLSLRNALPVSLFFHSPSPSPSPSFSSSSSLPLRFLRPADVLSSPLLLFRGNEIRCMRVELRRRPVQSVRNRILSIGRNGELYSYRNRIAIPLLAKLSSSPSLSRDYSGIMKIRYFNGRYDNFDSWSPSDIHEKRGILLWDGFYRVITRDIVNSKAIVFAWTLTAPSSRI